MSIQHNDGGRFEKMTVDEFVERFTFSGTLTVEVVSMKSDDLGSYSTKRYIYPPISSLRSLDEWKLQNLSEEVAALPIRRIVTLAFGAVQLTCFVD